MERADVECAEMYVQRESHALKCSASGGAYGCTARSLRARYITACGAPSAAASASGDRHGAFLLTPPDRPCNSSRLIYHERHPD